MTPLPNHHEVNVSSVATASSVGGATISIFGALTTSEVTAAVGVIIAFLSICINLTFQVRRDRREAALHAIQVAAIKKE